MSSISAKSRIMAWNEDTEHHSASTGSVFLLGVTSRVNENSETSPPCPPGTFIHAPSKAGRLHRAGGINFRGLFEFNQILFLPNFSDNSHRKAILSSCDHVEFRVTRLAHIWAVHMSEWLRLAVSRQGGERPQRRSVRCSHLFHHLSRNRWANLRLSSSNLYRRGDPWASCPPPLSKISLPVFILLRRIFSIGIVAGLVSSFVSRFRKE